MTQKVGTLFAQEISDGTCYLYSPRGWLTFEHPYAIVYHTSKLGRHLLAEETEGPLNASDSDLLHAAQVAWNALARLEHILMEAKKNG